MNVASVVSFVWDTKLDFLSHSVNDFFILFFSLLSLPLTHLTLFFSFPFSPHPHRSILSQSQLASPIKYSGDSDGPWFRSASLISNHMKTTGFLGRPWFGDPRPWLSERWWFWWVRSIRLLMVVGGGVWVILGLCWVYSSTEKTMASWVWVILLKDGCGCGSTKKTSLWVCSRGKEIIKNVKKMNILLNKCVE